jgi:ubiquinone/menaquinone biosynthesis C-methylase UbiE
MRILRKALESIVAHPRVYDGVQALFGAHEVRRHVAPYLRETEHKSVLDVGAGTGLYRALVPDTAQYIWQDIDPKKLAGFRRRHSASSTLLGDAANLPLPDDSVDATLCAALSHHLSDEELPRVLHEIARVTRERLVFMDAITRADSLLDRLLWSIDRGSYPRSAAALLAALQQAFVVDSVERFRVYHEYIVCTARPADSPAEPR